MRLEGERVVLRSSEIEERVDVGPLSLVLRRPADTEALLDEEAFERDEFLPYWAEPWPSGLALARHAADLELGGTTVLELGCGLGLPSLTAALGGAAVLATDWAVEALELLQRNAAVNGAAVETAVLNWFDPATLGTRTFDLVLAADVLYEERNAEPLLRLLADAVAPRGAALVADPGRPHAAAFLEPALAAGWAVATAPAPGLERGGIYRLCR